MAVPLACSSNPTLRLFRPEEHLCISLEAFGIRLRDISYLLKNFLPTFLAAFKSALPL
jgi:hypothetical protein